MKKTLVILGAAFALMLTSACNSGSSGSPIASAPASSATSASQTSASPSATAKAPESSPTATEGDAPEPSASPEASQEPPASQDAPEPASPEARAAAPSNNAPPAAADGCLPAGNGIPTSVKDFECLNLISTGGTDANGGIAWLGTDPFTLVTMVRDGNVAFSSKTPCNTLMSSVQVTDTQFIVDPNLAMTMMACQSPQSDYEKWVAAFFSSALDYTLNSDSLVLSNDHGTVTFKIPAA